MELIPLIYIIVAIAQIATLIVFVVIAGNVAKIKKQMVMNTRQYIEAGDMEAYAGNNEKAREYYLKAKYRLDIFKDLSNTNGDNKFYPGMSRPELENKINGISNTLTI